MTYTAVRRRAFWAALVLVLLMTAGWFIVTQPVAPSGRVDKTTLVRAERLRTHVSLLSETFVPRNHLHPENLDRAAAYIRTEFKRSGGVVSDQPFDVAGKTYRNVIASFGPDTSEEIVVGAHYDAFGEFPGADDNASGIAGLIELAHLLGNTSLRRRVELVAFTLEEPATVDGEGLFRTVGGSKIHAESLRRRGASILLMLSLEMIGTFRDEEGSQGYPTRLLRLFYPSRGNFVLVVGRLQDGWRARRVKQIMRSGSPLPVYSLNAPASLSGVDWSDHYNYWRQGYPALMITDTALNRNHEYHRKEDTADRLNYDGMAMVVQGVYAVVVDAAGNAS